MTHFKLALFGFGNVGQALAHLLLRKEIELKNDFDITFSTVAIATSRHGNALNPQGISLESAVKTIQSGEQLNKLSVLPIPPDPYDFIRICQADVLFENTPVNYRDGQPAINYIRTALASGMHVATANKGPVVHGYHELTTLARSTGRRFYFESAVMDGAPIFSLFRETLPAAKLSAFHGVLNSTTNLILTRMESGESFDQAVAYAQSIGIAETDPSGDIDGWDAAVKVAALVTVLMDTPFKPSEVGRNGIRGITPKAIKEALAAGKRWKLVCSARRNEGGIQARVSPELVDRASPMYAIEGTTSIIQFESDVLGELSILERDPGPHTTAYGLLADFLNAVRER